MELGTITKLVALISSIILTLTTIPVHTRTRCRGKWRIHACLGGNGKRSDPRLSTSNQQPTLAARLREARQLALKSAVRSGFESHRPSLSLLETLQTGTDSTISDNLLTRELTAWLQEDNLTREKEGVSVLRPEEGDDDFVVNDVTNQDEEDMTPVDLETVRDIFTALTLQRALRREAFSDRNSDTGDSIL